MVISIQHIYLNAKICYTLGYGWIGLSVVYYYDQLTIDLIRKLSKAGCLINYNIVL